MEASFTTTGPGSRAIQTIKELCTVGLVGREEIGKRDARKCEEGEAVYRSQMSSEKNGRME